MSEREREREEEKKGKRLILYKLPASAYCVGNKADELTKKRTSRDIILI